MSHNSSSLGFGRLNIGAEAGVEDLDREEKNEWEILKGKREKNNCLRKWWNEN